SRAAAAALDAGRPRGVLHVHRLLAVRAVSPDAAGASRAGLEVPLPCVAAGPLRSAGARELRPPADFTRRAQPDVVKTIAMVPVRNEAWVLEHALSCLSGFCDVVIVSDQGSTDGSQDVCRRFPKVVLLEAPARSDVDRLP